MKVQQSPDDPNVFLVTGIDRGSPLEIIMRPELPVDAASIEFIRTSDTEGKVVVKR